MLKLLAKFVGGTSMFPVPDGEARVGSHRDNDLVLAVPGVSRHHALVRRCPGGVEIHDLGSKNGLLVDGRRVESTVLTPGLRLQIGEAWLELAEISTFRELASDVDEIESSPGNASPTTDDLEAREPGYAEAIRLIYYLEKVDVGMPGERPDLLVRLRVALGADSLVIGKQSPRAQRHSILEGDGPPLSDGETSRLSAVLAAHREWPPEEVRLKRSGKLMVAIRAEHFIVARWSTIAPLREVWRRDFLRYAAERLFSQPAAFDVAKTESLRRALATTGGNRSAAARVLGVSRQTVYNLLRRRSP